MKGMILQFIVVASGVSSFVTCISAMAAARASDEEDSTRSFIFSIISSFKDYLGLQSQCFNFHVMKDHAFARTTAFVMSQYSPGGA